LVAGAADPVLVLDTTTVVLAPEVEVGAAGIGSKVTWALKDGPPGGQPPLAALAALLPTAFVELCSVTSLTPSIR
jgi:hypothetical protein